AAGARRAARRRMVGAPARRPRPHAVRHRRAQCAARGGGGRARRGARHGAPRPRPLAAGAGGVRRVTHVIQATDLVILAYFLGLNSFYALLLVLSIPEIWEQTRLAEDEDCQRLMQRDALPPPTLTPPSNRAASRPASPGMRTP